MEKFNNLAGNGAVSFSFDAIPSSLSELQALPEANLDTPYKTTALMVLGLCAYEKNPDLTFEILEFLNGPENVNLYTKSFIKERLTGKEYIPYSFFDGATVDNGYTPSMPLTITVSSNPYSFDEENWATLYVKSSGADSARPMKLRRDPSTGQWFISDIQILAGIRVPKELS